MATERYIRLSKLLRLVRTESKNETKLKRKDVIVIRWIEQSSYLLKQFGECLKQRADTDLMTSQILLQIFKMLPCLLKFHTRYGMITGKRKTLDKKQITNI